MEAQKIIAALILLTATSLAVTTIQHDVMVKINNNDAVVAERFLLGLNEEEMSLFNSISSSNVNDLKEWQRLSPTLNAHVLGKTTSLKVSTSKASGGQFGNEVKIEYTIANFSAKTDTTGRYEIYKIEGQQFLFYDNNTGIFSIGSADLTITLPDEVTETDVLETTPNPWYSSGNALRWISGTNADSFIVIYRKEIKISESFDFRRLIDTYFLKNPVYGGAIILIIILSIAYRKNIISIISESFSSEDEIQPPKREI